MGYRSKRRNMTQSKTERLVTTKGQTKAKFFESMAEDAMEFTADTYSAFNYMGMDADEETEDVEEADDLLEKWDYPITTTKKQTTAPQYSRFAEEGYNVVEVATDNQEADADVKPADVVEQNDQVIAETSATEVLDEDKAKKKETEEKEEKEQKAGLPFVTTKGQISTKKLKELMEKAAAQRKKAIEKLEERYRNKKMTLPMIEKIIREHVPIKAMWGGLSVYNGTTYRVLTEDLFCALCKSKLPEEVLDQLTSMRILKDAFQYTSLRDIDDREEKILAERYRYHVVFENCVVDLKTGDIMEHDECIAVPGMIHARYIDGELYTPTFDSLLDTMTDGDEETKILVKQMIAYCILLNLPNVRAFFWLGPVPGSGKSVLIDFIAQLLGTEQVSHVPADEIGTRFGCSQLVDRPVNLGPETTGLLSPNCINAIKTLSGDAVINIERKFMTRTDFPNRTKQIYASNNPPSFKNTGDTAAFWDRMKLIVCTGSVSKDERDPFFGQKLWAERDAIVTKIAIEYAPGLIKNGFNFIEPKKSVKQKDIWAEESMDNVQKFYKNCIEKADTNSYVPSQELFEAFQEYTGDTNLKANGFGMKFCQYVPNKDKKKVPGYKNAVNCYFGIRLKPKAEW